MLATTSSCAHCRSSARAGLTVTDIQAPYRRDGKDGHRLIVALHRHCSKRLRRHVAADFPGDSLIKEYLTVEGSRTQPGGQVYGAPDRGVVEPALVSNTSDRSGTHSKPDSQT